MTPQPWMLAALGACIAGLWFLWTRGMHVPAVVLLVLTFALVFFFGRRMEDDRAVQWQQAAQQVQGTYLRPQPASWLGRFGTQAPWVRWASDGELQVPHAIDGSAQQPPFWLLQVRYSVRERRGEEHPDSWYEVTVAVLPAGGSAPALEAPDGHELVRDPQHVYVWKQGTPGAGASLRPEQVPQLLQAARSLLRPPSSAAPAR
jgi:hypothetical protein